jgi:hypothetical protein
MDLRNNLKKASKVRRSSRLDLELKIIRIAETTRPASLGHPEDIFMQIVYSEKTDVAKRTMRKG